MEAAPCSGKSSPPGLHGKGKAVFEKYRERKAERAVKEAELFVDSVNDKYYKIRASEGIEAAEEYLTGIDPMMKAVVERARRKSSG